VFPFNEEELADFPFSSDELAPYYDLVAERIGISGVDDDLARHLPVHRNLLPPLSLDEHSRRLLEKYEANRDAFRALGATLGRSRTATLSADRDGRVACKLLGRCLLARLATIVTPDTILRWHRRLYADYGIMPRRDGSARKRVLDGR